MFLLRPGSLNFVLSADIRLVGSSVYHRPVIPVTTHKLPLLYFVVGCYSQKPCWYVSCFYILTKELAMYCFRSVMISLTLTLIVSAPVSADVLLIESIQSAPAIATPRNGQTMSQVRQQFGEPAQELAAVGEPPISRWEYTGFSVFFENDVVLHSVIQHAKNN